MGSRRIWRHQLNRTSALLQRLHRQAGAAQATADAAQAAADAAQSTANTADGKADANTANKVAKAGDTMTGNLTVPDATENGHAVNLGQLPRVTDFHDPAGLASWRIVGTTLECWGLTTPAGGAGSIAYPMGFAQLPVVTFGARRESDTNASVVALMAISSSITASGFNYRSTIVGNNQQPYDFPVWWHAIGEWDGVS